MHDERPMEETMDARDVERARPKKVMSDHRAAAEGAVAASDVSEAVRPKQMN